MLLLQCKTEYRDMMLMNALRRYKTLAYNPTEGHIVQQQKEPDCTAAHHTGTNGDNHKGLGITGHGSLNIPKMPEIDEEEEAEVEVEAQAEAIPNNEVMKNEIIAPFEQLVEP